MKLFQQFCELVVSALGLSSFSPWGPSDQYSIIPTPGHVDTGPAQDAGLVETMGSPPKGPIFKPPNSSPGFVCDYSAMKGWRHSAGIGARTRWLSHPIDADYPAGGVYDIFTNYESYTPKGVKRRYTLNVDEHPINADGFSRRAGGKAFNATFPGPLIEACWGDSLEITVINNLQYNGTAIHWHGVRMLNSFENDGVNAITQCPIAPGDSFTYKFNVTQYGTSWYHSHYSSQYPDGLVGPMTFHGPTAADYDVALKPFIISDWSHNSAFQDFSIEIRTGQPPMQSNILNGAGFFNCTLANQTEADGCGQSPPIFEQVFERGRKYLLKLINASTASTFIFSIDKHVLQVVEADFVPIEPYYTDSVLIGIGQRYHVIVEAKPSNDLIPVEDQNYWIRTVGAVGCSIVQQPNPTIGIIRYNAGSTKTPTSKAFRFDTACSDEPLESLVPVVPWTVSAGPKPANNIEEGKGDNYPVGLLLPGPGKPPIPHGNFARWTITDHTMWLNFSNPTINNIGDPSFNPPEYCLVTQDHEVDDWVYLIISMNSSTVDKAVKSKTFLELAHPMHLHGHDFVILAQQNRPYTPAHLTDGTFNYNNPPRRDVALLPSKGYVAIGFKTDNPGIWIMHCHIAWHASAGLALQIREREHDIKLTPAFLKEKDRICTNWVKWHSNSSNWWNPHEFQEDSGV